MNWNPLLRRRLQECGWQLVRIALTARNARAWKPTHRWWPAVLLALMAAIASTSQAVADDQVELGRMLFEHKWAASDALSPFGDGLGPVHNADSCVACHHLGGSGGAGGVEHNVDLLSLVPAKGGSNRQSLAAIRSRAGKVHPDFAPGRNATTIVLHRFGTEPRYERWRLGALGFKMPEDLQSERAAAVRRTAAEKLADE